MWLSESTGSWHFVSLPEEVADQIRGMTDAASRPGFGSVRVSARIGGTAWRTSVFPDAKRGTYVLPVKQPVRRAEGVSAGDVVTVAVDLLE